MKMLALSINGQKIPLPQSIDSFTTKQPNFVSYILGNFISFLFFLILLTGLFYMLFSGFQWLTSAGEEEKIKKAKASITYTLAGMVIAFLAFLIVNIIQGFFKVPALTH